MTLKCVVLRFSQVCCQVTLCFYAGIVEVSEVWAQPQHFTTRMLKVQRVCIGFVFGLLFRFVILLDRLMGWTEEKRSAVFQDFQGLLSRFYIDGRKKPSISEFINIAVHMSVILLAGSNLTNTHQYPIIIWDIISSIIKRPHQLWNHWEARTVLVRELGFVKSTVSHTHSGPLF